MTTVNLKRSDCKELVGWLWKRQRQKAVRAYWVRDDDHKGPVYALEDQSGTIIAYGWFGASGSPCFVQNLEKL